MLSCTTQCSSPFSGFTHVPLMAAEVKLAWVCALPSALLILALLPSPHRYIQKHQHHFRKKNVSGWSPSPPHPWGRTNRPASERVGKQASGLLHFTLLGCLAAVRAAPMLNLVMLSSRGLGPLSPPGPWYFLLAFLLLSR